MSQHWPNFVERNSTRGPAPVQTKRVTYTVKSGDILSSITLGGVTFQNLLSGPSIPPLTFDVPFQDTNYTVSVAFEFQPGPNNPGNTWFFAPIVFRSTDHVGVGMAGPNVGAGDVLTIHAVAFHD